MPLDPPKPRSLNIPLTLEAVCKRWREIAMSTAGIWDSIHLELSNATIKHDKLGAKVWLARASGHGWPLMLWLGPDVFGGPHYFPPDTSVIIESLLPHSHRWKLLYCVLPSELLCLLSIVRTQLSSFQQLFIALPRRDAGPEEDIDIFEHAPRLAKVSLKRRATSNSLGKA